MPAELAEATHMKNEPEPKCAFRKNAKTVADALRSVREDGDTTGKRANQSHELFNVRNWDGSDVKVLHVRSYRKGAGWDNHHRSNHEDYMAGELKCGRRGTDACVVRVSTDTCTRVTWVGNVQYPGLFVEKDASPGGSARDERDEKEDDDAGRLPVRKRTGGSASGPGPAAPRASASAARTADPARPGRASGP
jgi:hypothetical protein